MRPMSRPRRFRIATGAALGLSGALVAAAAISIWFDLRISPALWITSGAVHFAPRPFAFEPGITLNNDAWGSRIRDGFGMPDGDVWGDGTHERRIPLWIPIAALLVLTRHLFRGGRGPPLFKPAYRRSRGQRRLLLAKWLGTLATAGVLLSISASLDPVRRPVVFGRCIFALSPGAVETTICKAQSIIVIVPGGPCLLPSITRFGRLATQISFPLWIPLLAFLLPTIWLWRRGRLGDHSRRCHQCGYDLTGNTSGRCPECGQVIAAVKSE